MKKQTERKGRESQIALQKKLLSATRDILIMTDLELRVLTMNSYAATIVTGGLRANLGKSLLELFPSLGEPHYSKKLIRVVETAALEVIAETPLKLKDEWRLATFTLFRNDDHLIVTGRVLEVGVTADLASPNFAGRYRLIFEGSSDAICLIKDWRIVEANEKLIRMLGYSHQELIGTPIDQLLRAEDLSKITNWYSTQPSDELTIHRYELLVKHKNGSLLNAEISVEPITVDGAPMGFVFMRNITAEKLVQEELRRFKLIIEHANYGVVVTDLEGNVLYLNRHFANLHNYDPKDVIGKNLRMLQADEQRDYTGNVFDLVRHYGEFSSIELWHKRKDGSRFPMLLNGVLIKSDPNLGDFIAATGMDVTEPRNAAEFLRLSEQRYRTLVEKAPLGIISVDASGNILSVNAKMLKILNSPSPEATMKINLLTFGPLIESGITEVFRRCLQTGKGDVSEHKYTSLWSKTSHLRYHLSPMKDNQNHVIGVFAIVEDLTERTLLEEKLDRKSSLESIGQFSHDIGHCIKNCNNTLLGAINMLKLIIPSPDPEVHKFLRIASGAGDDIQRLVYNLNDYIKKVEVEKHYVLTQNLFTTIQEQLKLLAEPLNIQIHIAIDGSATQLYVDEELLRRSLMNLGTNALDATPAGGWVKVSAYALELPILGGEPSERKTYSVIEVADNGCGMSPEVKQHLFEPHFTTKIHKGMGLGLPSVLKIISQHDGRIEVDSDVGNGSTFRIFLPWTDNEPARRPPFQG